MFIELNTEDIKPRGLEAIPLKERKLTLDTETKGVSMLPVNDLEDVILAICDIANDINDKSGVVGFLDNLPGIIAAYEGKENILPQAADVDAVELEAITAKVKERLKLTDGTEAVIGKVLDFIWAGGEVYKAVQAAKSE